MLVMGIDPGSHKTGWGVVSCQGSALEHVASGVIEATGDLLGRLSAIGDDLQGILGRYQPHAVAVESLFHHKNTQSALKLGHARGVVLLCIARSQSHFFEYAPAEIKRAATGNGRASKELVGQMVRMLLGHGNTFMLDESDALAAAICHAQVGAERLPR